MKGKEEGEGKEFRKGGEGRGREGRRGRWKGRDGGRVGK